MNLTRRHALTLVAGASLSLTGACSNGNSKGASSGSGRPRKPLDQLRPIPDPKSLTGPSTATLVQTDITPVTVKPKQQLPVTVTSHDPHGDKKVVVKDTSRVVAINLSGSIAATVQGLGLGHLLVARDQSTTFPSAMKLPQVTSGGHSINAEAVIAPRPTVIITDGSIGPRDVIEQLRDSGITVVFVKNSPSFAGAQQLARDVAAVLGVPSAGDRLARQIGQGVATTKKDIAKIAPQKQDKKLRIVFLYLRGNAGIYYLFGKTSGADELITGLGAIDIASQQGWVGMEPMTDEAFTRADPDLVLVMTDGIKSAGGVDGLLKTKPAIAMTTAGKKRRFVDMADGDILSFGPRSAEVLDALARAVYAPHSS